MPNESTANHWWVFSPEYGEVIPLLDDGSGPIEYVRDVVCIDADTKREAIRRGVAKMDRERMNWPKMQRESGCNPFAGVQAESATCPHGVTCCECERNEADYCEMCEQENP